MPYPFVAVRDYQYVGSIEFGAWDDLTSLYQFGDGDYRSTEEVQQMSSKVQWLSFEDIEEVLRQ